MSSDDNDKSTEQVLDYYKKYSQNRNLPKYFSGSSLSYLPPIVASDEAPTSTNKCITQSNRAITISEIKVTVHEEKAIDESSSSARSSTSPTDHRKLEWDNGADIGYSSVMKSHKKKLQKSSSLPILDHTNANIDVPTLVPSTFITQSTSDENIGLLLFSSSSSQAEVIKSSARLSSKFSSESTCGKQMHPTSTELSSSCKSKASKFSEADSDLEKFGDFQKTIDFLKQQIGLPGAHSTPYIEEARSGNRKAIAGHMAAKPSETPLSHKERSHSSFEGLEQKRIVPPDDSDIQDKRSSPKKDYKNSSKNVAQLKEPSSSSKKQSKDKVHGNVKPKIVELSISTPINVVCKGLALSERRADIVKTVTPRAVQTESIIQQHIETQFNFEDNDVDDKAHYIPLAKQETFSISEELSGSASSFEYINLNKDIPHKKIGAENIRTRIGQKTSSVSGVLKEIPVSKTTTESSSISKTSFEDIDLHLRILHKLLKTKQLQSSAKKKYIHKLLKEFNQLETSNDSNSSSDLFIPKKGIKRNKVVFKEKRGGDVISSCNSTNDHLLLPPETEQFEGEKPLAQTEENRSSSYSVNNKMSYQASIKLASANISTFSNRKIDVCDETHHCKVSSPYVLTDLNQQKPHVFGDISKKADESKMYRAKFGIRSEVNVSKPHHIQFETIQAVNELPSCSCFEEEEPEDKKPILRTESSQKLCHYVESSITDESSTTSNSAALAHPANCRANVAASRNSSEDYLLKFAENERTYQLNWINNEISHLSKLKNILELKDTEPTHSKTSTYNVAQKQESGKSSGRDYIIQTRLDLPQDQYINYMLDGKEYVVSGSQKSSNGAANCILADIIVNSNENGTNIKVRTICSSCKQVVCICGSQKTIQSKLSSILSASDDSRCLVCHQAVCICSQTRNNVDNEKFDVTSKPDTAKEGSSSSEKEINKPANLQLEQDIQSESSDVEVVSEVDFNSLQKVFEKCCCTFQNPNCGCDFVKKLLDKFQVNLQKTNIANKAGQSETLEGNKLSFGSQKNPCLLSTSAGYQTEKHSQESRTQTLLPSSEDTKAQVGFKNDKHSASQTGRNLLCRCTQTNIDDIVESTQTPYSDGLKEECLSTTNIKLLKDGIIQSTLNEATASTQTDPKHNVRDQLSSTSNIASLKDEISQSLKAESSARTQTNKKLLRNNAVQVSDDIEHASVQAEINQATQAVQTEPGMDNLFRKDQKSSGTSELQQASKESPVTRISFGQIPEVKDVETNSNSLDVGIQYPSLTKIRPIQEVGMDSQNSSVGSNGTSSTSSSSGRTNGSSRIICFCCKQKAFLAEVSYLQEGNDSLAVCSRCYYNQPRFCSHNPRFMCRCWSYYHTRQNVQTGQYCTCCRMEVSKCPRRGVMYTVTLQDDTSERPRFAKNDVKSLKVQDGWTRKSLKNKENYYKKDDDMKNSLRRGRRKKTGHDNDKRQMGKDADEKQSKSENGKVDQARNKDSEGLYTLTEYLIKNKPEFICSAEYRRQVLLNSRILREQQREDVKLQFLENNKKFADQAKFKLFTEREMKEINKKNYKMLPEVRKEQVNQRENRLRSADRLISNIFAKKVQKFVLRGRGNFPIDKALTNL